jgi:hypothetical protein
MKDKKFLIVARALVIYMIAALVIVSFAGTGAAVSLSNSGGGTWKYQREISIKENSGTTLTDYQVLIELKGADFPVEAKSDGADVRFTDSKGNELNYWIESWDYSGKSAKVWVKIPSISAGSSTVIRMHYGNSGASVISNGDKVFDFFDDFEYSDAVTNHGWGNTDTRCVLQTTSTDWATSGTRSMKIVHTIDVVCGIIRQIPIPTPFLITYDAKQTQSSTATIVVSSATASNWNAGTTPEFTFPYIFTVFTIYDYTNPITYTDSYNYPVIWVGQSTSHSSATAYVDNFRVRKYASSEPTIILSSPKSSSLTITKSAIPYSLRQFQESTIKVLIENSGTSEVKAIEIRDSIHPSFDLTGGDFPNPKKFDSIRAGESRELQYTIKSKESGAFTLDPATVTYADSEGNIQEVKSEPVSIKVVSSSPGDNSGVSSGQNSKTASVNLHGEKTDVLLGENVLLKLSAINIIGNPIMHVQVIIIPPNGWSVTSSEFSKSGAGQYTTMYDLKPEDGSRDIEVKIMPNQIGDNFEVKGRIIYYFGDDLSTREDHTLNLPIKVRKETTSISDSEKLPGFEIILAGIGMILALSFRRR